ncbi:DUF2381 family protein [Pyxidicoccus xibeiensis]|uniref:DUF2381 family protein n=1 Tax=Pyxidicoccus xibeiensis TaxID=2906759 RepID=UPI0020A7B796|nr:DUF2381 family protein [Pyxidicoccus xibeiensis]MCP3140086.1 DUF2381 family protein [Pyxidicoccus xibeiensis]
MLLGSTAARPAPAPVQAQLRRIELAPEPLHEPLEIAIQAGTATLLIFESRLERDKVELEGREHFSRVAVSEDTLALLPTEAVREGERLRLTVRFAEGATPAEARFVLVVDRNRADTQVEVLHSRRVSEPALMEQELQRLREENSRLRAARGPEGLAGAIAAAWVNEQGVAAASLRFTAPSVTGTTHELDITAVGFRTSARVAVELELAFSASERPWSMESAALIGPKGQRLRIVQTWQSGPGQEGARKVRIAVEAAAETHEAHGPHALELREAGGDRTLTISPVTFPSL